MKRFAAEHPVVAVPVVVEPVPVLVPAIIVPVEVRDILTVVRVPPKLCGLSPMPPPLEYSRG